MTSQHESAVVCWAISEPLSIVGSVDRESGAYFVNRDEVDSTVLLGSAAMLE